MTIISIDKAKSINKQVRDRFSEGFKSSNKVYHHPIDPALNKDPIELMELSHINWTDIKPETIMEPTHYRDPNVIRELKRLHGDLSEQYRRRNKNAFGAVEANKKQVKIGIGTKYSDAAAALAQIAEAKLAGNCSEMAIYAAKLVNDLPEAKGLTYLGWLKSGDHVFCIVLKKAPYGLLPTVNEFSSQDGFSEWVVVDPWLNVCCAANDYPSKVEAQLQNWDSRGKRILWKEKFYKPTGAYKQSFLTSQVQFKKYL
jgi:hypothetical protein